MFTLQFNDRVREGRDYRIGYVIDLRGNWALVRFSKGMRLVSIYSIVKVQR